MASAVGVTLACGCIIVADAGGAKLTPVCAEHTADPQALGLAAGQNPVVQALAASASPAGSVPGFTYNGAQMATVPLYRVRFTLSDTDDQKPLFSDGEILAVLEESGKDWLTASLVLLDALSARYAGACDESVGSVSMAYSQRSAGYQRLADTLRARLAKRGIPFSGGISRADKLSRLRDPSRVQSAFTATMFQSYRRPYDTSYIGGGDWYMAWGAGPALYPNGL